MGEFIDNEGERHIDPFCFDEFGMIDRGVKAIRFLYAVSTRMVAYTLYR